MRLSEAERERGRTVSGRLICILDAVAAQQGDVGLTELAIITGISKPTVYRLAKGLVAHRMLVHSGNGYRLGFHLFELGQRVPLSRQLRDLALPVMSDLLEASREIVQLAVLDGHEVVYVEKLTGRHSSPAPSRVGSRLPAYSSALGKAILAFSEKSQVDRVLQAPMPARTPTTLTTPRQLMEELDDIRQRGIAYDRGEGTAGIVCVASPILDWRTRAVAAISITGPRERLRVARFATAVHAAALGIGRAWNLAELRSSNSPGAGCRTTDR